MQEKRIAKLSVTRSCLYLGFSRQAYYQTWSKEEVKAEQAKQILSVVQGIHMKQPRMGTRKLHHLLHRSDDTQLHIGRDRLFALLRWQRLLVFPKRAYHKTTQSHHRFYKHPNLLKDKPLTDLAKSPEKVWVADITYLPVEQGEAYLSLVTDAFSRKIVGFHVHDSLHAVSVLGAFKKAIKGRRTTGEVIHHSDRGIQYCSKVYQAFHAKHGVKCSMTDGYDCYQNALAERVNGILKNEFLLSKPKTIEQAKVMVKEAVETYNTERPHLALKYKTPDEVHRAFLT